MPEQIYNDIEGVLDKLRLNSSVLANYHRKRYLLLKARLKYYRIPIIVISACNGAASVSLQPFMRQTYISLLNMTLSLFVGIISSIEMFKQVNRELESSLVSQKEFYILSCDIYKYLALQKHNRITDERTFLSDTYTRYIKLIESSYTLKRKIDDKLLEDISAKIASLTSINSEVFTDTSSDENNLV